MSAPPTRLHAHHRLRALVGFAVAGLAFLGLSRLLADPAPERPLLVVHLPADADATTRERSIDEHVLVELGLTLGWRLDPLIRDRVERSLAPLAPSDLHPLDRAEALDLLRRDPLIRARLAERARKTLPEPGAPDDATLGAYLQTHAARFERPPVLRFEHRYTRDPERAAALLESATTGSPQSPTDRGEPELHLGPTPTRTASELLRLLGRPASEALLAAPLDTWTLVASPLGHHLVRVIERHPPTLPPLTTIRPEVLQAWRDELRPELHRAALDRLRASFLLDLRSLPSTPSTAATSEAAR